MAGPLFTLAERMHNKRLAQLLESLDSCLHCVLPQERGAQFYPDLKAVVADCFEQIDRCDFAIACADGPDSDSGTATEIGYAYARGKPVIVYRTDFRGSEVDGVNAMLRYGCTAFINAPAYEISLEALAEKLIYAIKSLPCYA